MLSPPHRKFPHKLFGSIVLAAMLNSSRRKPTAEIAAIQSPQALPSGQIPIAPAVPRNVTHRDFVPWRFSDAGSCASAWVIIPASEKPAQTRTSQSVPGGMAVLAVVLRTYLPNHQQQRLWVSQTASILAWRELAGKRAYVGRHPIVRTKP